MRADVAFISGFNEILLIGALDPPLGAALGFFLVRSERLRPAGAPPEAEPASEAQRAGSRLDPAAPASRTGADAAESCGSRTCC